MNIAIYSRKSKFTGKGDSIENQIQICKDYAYQQFRNTDLTFEVFEDEGFTGKNTNRPHFLKMMKLINKNNFDVLICYKLDRISRNVADFSSTLETLQNNNCDFISVSEQFDTSTPMGRAMIYIASVFAQLERETIAERVKDNMVELAKMGRWSGGKTPLGYKSEQFEYVDDMGDIRKYSKLAPDKEEQKLVKLIYKTYLEQKSLHKTEVYFTQNNIKHTSGILFDKTTLKIILQNPVYVKATAEVMEFLDEDGWNVFGKPDGNHSLLSYNKTQSITKNGKTSKTIQPKENWIAAISNCEGIIEADEWLAVQKQFTDNKSSFPRLGKTNTALLTGIIRCGKCRGFMQVSHGKVSKKTNEKNFYYKCAMKTRSKGMNCDCKNLKGNDIESALLTEIENIGANKEKFLKALQEKYNSKKIKDETNSKKLALEKTLGENKKKIDNLVSKLAISDDIADILIEKIKALKKENETLQDQIDKINTGIQINKSELANVTLVSSILDKCSNIKKLDKEQQKAMINILVDKIWWDGESCDIEFINSKKK